MTERLISVSAERFLAGRAVAYVCSDSGTAMAAQQRLDELAAEAAWLGHSVHARVCDSGSVSVPLHLRPGWVTVVSTVEAGLADAVIVRAASDLATEPFDRIPILGWLETAGARLVVLELLEADPSWSGPRGGTPRQDRVAAADSPVVQECRDYAADPTSVSPARGMIKRCLAQRCLGTDVVDTACLLASELLTNAIVHGCRPADTVTVSVECDAEHVQISVSDPSPCTPRPCSPDADAESGRGLRLIDACADQWGVAASSSVPGKRVWFALNLVKRTPVS